VASVNSLFTFAFVAPYTAGGNGSWNPPNDGYTHQFTYPSGIIFPAGYVFNSFNVEESPSFSYAYLHSFLTSN